MVASTTAYADKPELGDDICWSATGRTLDHTAVRVLQQLHVTGLVQNVAALQTKYMSAVFEEIEVDGARSVVPVEASNRRRGRYRS